MHMTLCTCAIYRVHAITHARTDVRTYTHTHTHTRTHRRTHTHMHAHTCTDVHTHLRTRAHSHTHAHTHAHTRTHVRMHTHTHVRMHINTHTHTHARGVASPVKLSPHLLHCVTDFSQGASGPGGIDRKLEQVSLPRLCTLSQRIEACLGLQRVIRKATQNIFV